VLDHVVRGDCVAVEIACGQESEQFIDVAVDVIARLVPNGFADHLGVVAGDIIDVIIHHSANTEFACQQG